MNRTENLRLAKPEGTEGIDIDLLNGNADVLDAEVASRVKLVNGVEPDEDGNVALADAGAVLSVNGVTPDENGNVALNDSAYVKSVNGVEPDENGDVTIEDPGTVKNVTSSFAITSTQGTISQMSALKCGAMIALQFRLTTSQVVPADGTLSATVNCDSSMRPVGITPGEVSLASVQKAKITTGGAVSATATERLQAGADIITFYFTYMCINR